jgi:hypothetical protein
MMMDLGADLALYIYCSDSFQIWIDSGCDLFDSCLIWIGSTISGLTAAVICLTATRFG